MRVCLNDKVITLKMAVNRNWNSNRKWSHCSCAQAMPDWATY